MKNKVLFLLIAFITLSMVAKAQMDSWMLNQWLNEMNADTYRQQKQLTDEFMKLLEQENKRNDANATATCILLPGGENTFFAHITAEYISLNNLEVTQKKCDGYETTVSSSNFFAAYGQIITSAIFTPGMSIAVKRKDTGKVLARIDIPRKESVSYNIFLQKAYAIAKMYGTQGNGTYPVEALGGNSSSSTVRKACSNCQGKGWIRGSSTSTYGTSGTHWCTDCGEYVNASHSHNRCPSCFGRGYIDKIR